uniref:Uncharacterized protein n=1 Tax=Arundo donax TaxID=35708 RepID=A0A0A9D6L8_ARUDO
MRRGPPIKFGNSVWVREHNLLREPTHLHIRTVLANSFLVIRGVVIEKRCEEERLGHVVRHVLGEQRVLDASDEALAEDDVRWLDIAHPYQRHGSVEMVDLRHVVRAQAAVLLQRRGLKVGALPRHRP